MRACCRQQAVLSFWEPVLVHSVLPTLAVLPHAVVALQNSSEAKVLHIINIADKAGLPADAGRRELSEVGKDHQVKARNDVYNEVARRRKAGKVVPNPGDQRDHTDGQQRSPTPGTNGDQHPIPGVNPGPRPLGTNGDQGSDGLVPNQHHSNLIVPLTSELSGARPQFCIAWLCKSRVFGCLWGALWGVGATRLGSNVLFPLDWGVGACCGGAGRVFVPSIGGLENGWFDPGTWLPVPGFEGCYEVSDHGQVFSLPRKQRQRELYQRRRAGRGGAG
jgi:hypothetical protein